MTRSIHKTIHIDAPPEMVWDYLTRSDHLARWFHRPKADLALGAYEMPGEDGAPLVWGDVTRIEPPYRLTYSFTARPMGQLVTTVDYTLTALHGGTKLDLVHAGWPDTAKNFGLLVAFDAGWDKHLLRLRDA